MNVQQKQRARHRRRRPWTFSCRDDDIYCDSDEKALSLSKKEVINNILEKRQKEGPPQPEGADSLATDDDSRSSDDDTDGDTNAALEQHVESPRSEAGGVKKLPMTDDERTKACADVFGRPPPGVARTEERLLALEIEVEKLPTTMRKALTEAMRKHPLLFVNSPHTKMMLEQDEEEFDVVSAVQRLARYWECRLSLFGEEACYAPGVFPEPTLVDYQKYYERTMAIFHDPRTDEMVREDAADMLSDINNRKIDALEQVLEKMEDDSKEEFNRGEHDDSAESEFVLELSALDMAMETPDELKLQFLRVEDMIEAKAAQRLVQYWKTGIRLFGPDFMHKKRVALDDVEDCSELFRCNQIRLMPEEDEFGRSIIVWRQIASPGVVDGSVDLLSQEEISHLGINEDHYAKVFWYILHAALERESCLQNGFVLIADCRIMDGNYRKRQRHRQAVQNVVHSVPAKLRAGHLVLGSRISFWQQQILGGSYIVGLSFKRRLVIHGGTIEEIVAKLAGSFGIGAEKLPVDFGGAVEAEYFSRWLEERSVANL